MEPVIVPASQGWQWIVQGFRLFRAYSALWLLFLFLYWTGLLTMASIPVLGPLLAVLVVPGLTAGVMVATRATISGQPPSIKHFFLPFQARRRAQLQLGLVYLCFSALAMVVGVLIDGGTAPRPPLPTGDRAAMAREANAYLRSVGITMLILAPAMLALWFSPALVHWRGMGPGKALFFSFFACLRNWRAFLLYGLGWLFLFAMVPIVLSVLLAVFLTADMRGIAVASFVAMPCIFILMGAVACSFYPTYWAVFPQGEEHAGPAAPPPSASPSASPSETPPRESSVDAAPPPG